MTAMDFDTFGAGFHTLAQILPTCQLDFAAANVFIQRNVELFDQVWPITLDEISGVYSLKCSLNSVTKYPKRLNIS